MKLRRIHILMFLVLLFLVNQVIERIFHLYIYLVHSYLDDLIVIPIVLGTYQWTVQKIKKEAVLPFYIIPLTVLIFSVYFEYILPYRSAKYTSDPLDILMYISGAFFYTFLFYFRLTAKSPKVLFVRTL